MVGFRFSLRHKTTWGFYFIFVFCFCIHDHIYSTCSDPLCNENEQRQLACSCKWIQAAYINSIKGASQLSWGRHLFITSESLHPLDQSTYADCSAGVVEFHDHVKDFPSIILHEHWITSVNIWKQTKKQSCQTKPILRGVLCTVPLHSTRKPAQVSKLPPPSIKSSYNGYLANGPHFSATSTYWQDCKFCHELYVNLQLCHNINGSPSLKQDPCRTALMERI